MSVKIISETSLACFFFWRELWCQFRHQHHHLTLSLCGCMLGCCCIVHKLYSALWRFCLIYAIHGWLLCKIIVADVGGLRMDVLSKLTDACQSRIFLKLLTCFCFWREWWCQFCPHHHHFVSVFV